AAIAIAFLGADQRRGSRFNMRGRWHARCDRGRAGSVPLMSKGVVMIHKNFMCHATAAVRRSAATLAAVTAVAGFAACQVAPAGSPDEVAVEDRFHEKSF